MALQLKFKYKNIRNPILFFKRIKSAFNFLYYLRKTLRISDIKIAFYLYGPDENFYPEFKFQDFTLGLLFEFEKKINELSVDEKAFVGFKIDANIRANSKKIPFYLLLNPEKYCRKEGPDIRIDIYASENINHFEELESNFSGLRKKFVEIIKKYNEKVNPKSNCLFIKKAILSKIEDEDNIKKWSFLYLKEPVEAISEFYRGLGSEQKEVKSRLSLTDEDKLARELISRNEFAFAFDKLAIESGIEVGTSSLVLIPKSSKAMDKFISQINDKIIYPTIKLFRPREEINKDIQDILRKI